MRKPRAVWRQLDLGDDVAEGCGPGIELIDAIVAQQPGLQIALHGVHFGDGVGDRRAGCEHDGAAGAALFEIADLQEQVGRPLAFHAREPLDAGMAGAEAEVLEGMRLVDEQEIDAEFLEGDALVLALLGQSARRAGLRGACSPSPDP